MFFVDLKNGLKMLPRVFWICLFDISSRYTRTFLGPFWPVLAIAMGSVCISILWGLIFKLDLSVSIPHITTGFIVWFFVSGTVIEGVNCFINQSPTFLSTKLPISFYPLLVLMRGLLTFGQSLLVVILVNLVFPPTSLQNILWFIPVLVVSSINLFLMIYLLGFLTARYRDVGHLVISIMPMLFFLSPVVFKASFIGEGLEDLVYLNPLSSMIICLRDSLIGIALNVKSLSIQLVMILLQGLILMFIFHFKHKRLCFWL